MDKPSTVGTVITNHQKYFGRRSATTVLDAGRQGAWPDRPRVIRAPVTEQQ